MASFNNCDIYETTWNETDCKFEKPDRFSKIFIDNSVITAYENNLADFNDAFFWDLMFYLLLGLIGFAMMVSFALLISYLLKKLFMRKNYSFMPRHTSTPKPHPCRRTINPMYDVCDDYV